MVYKPTNKTMVYNYCLWYSYNYTYYGLYTNVHITGAQPEEMTQFRPSSADSSAEFPRWFHPGSWIVPPGPVDGQLHGSSTQIDRDQIWQNYVFYQVHERLRRLNKS